MNDGSLSARELDVVRLLAEGCSNYDISRRLCISPNTAANHVRAILQKSGCTNRTQAAMQAVRAGLAVPGGAPTN
jgi:DNA-binding NarL/FixJ family response regulator